jgi:hypothetical protein
MGRIGMTPGAFGCVQSPREPYRPPTVGDTSETPLTKRRIDTSHIAVHQEAAHGEDEKREQEGSQKGQEAPDHGVGRIRT